MKRLTRTDLAFLALVLVLGLINLPQPFAWDQSLFALGARKLHAGAVLYRDFWDLKQPGIYVFYALGGSIFGFTEVGIHAFELLYLMLFALALVVILKDHVEHSWAPGLAALLTVGYFYAFTTDAQLTQAEGLGGFPIFLSLAYATRSSADREGGASSLLLSGLMGGVALVFKIAFLPIVGVFWLVAVIARMRARSGLRPARAASDLAWLALGVAIPLVPVMLYLAAHGVLGTAYKITFGYPARMLTHKESFRFDAFVTGSSWFVSRWAPLLGLGFLGAFLPSRRGRDVLTWNLLLWFVLGGAVILAQRWSYWEYHFLLLTVPVGVLAARGVDLVAGAARPGFLGRAKARMVLVGGVALLASWAAGAALFKSTVLWHHHLALRPARRFSYQCDMSYRGYYRTVRDEVAFLSAPGALPGPVFVVGNPIYNWLSGRDQGVPRHGAVLAPRATAGEWVRWTADLSAVRPPYIFLENGYCGFIEYAPERCASFLALLARDYRMIRRDNAGAWYELRGPAAQAP